MDLRIEHSNYPELLKEIHKAPAVLHLYGEYIHSDKFAIAIVGSRNATFYGIQTAERFAYELAQKGITVISGMAKGIDAAAHRGALRAGGRTIAVLGSSLDKVYPREHISLMEEIAKHGCVMSEFAEGTEPRPFNFPQRNRIISGLSLGVLVVEASRRSGSLITAALAVEQGRQVYAVPGLIDSLLSEGTHALIKDGAKLIDRSEDILEDLRLVIKDMGLGDVLPEGLQDAAPELSDNQKEDSAEHNDLTQQILSVIGSEALDAQQLQSRIQVPLSEIQEVLLRLEIQGKVLRLLSGTYQTVSV